jgi:transcriptional regulator with XRE-family HTH domain
MNNLYEKIYVLCAERGITAGKLCSEINVRRSLITDLKHGRKQSLSADTLSKISNYFSISIDYLLGLEEKEKPTAQGGELTSAIQIPIYSNFNASTLTTPPTHVAEYVELRPSMAKHGKLFAMRVPDDAAAPDVRCNDVLICVSASDVPSDAMAVVQVGTTRTLVRRVHKHGSAGLSLLADNSSAPLFFTCEECLTVPVTILARVLELRRCYDTSDKSSPPPLTNFGNSKLCCTARTHFQVPRKHKGCA